MKKLLGFLLVASLILMNMPADASDSFKDIGSDTVYHYAINWMAEHNILKGYEDGYFRPSNAVTRAELLKMVLLMEGNAIPEIDKDPAFPDVALADWHAKYVAYGMQKGTIQGYPDGMFRPNSNITRAEALKIIGREFFGNVPDGMETLSELDKAAITGCDNKFMRDVERGSWYEKYALFAHEKCIIPWQMLSEHNLFPARHLNRGEAAELIFRARVVHDFANSEYQIGWDPK